MLAHDNIFLGDNLLTGQSQVKSIFWANSGKSISGLPFPCFSKTARCRCCSYSPAGNQACHSKSIGSRFRENSFFDSLILFRGWETRPLANYSVYVRTLELKFIPQPGADHHGGITAPPDFGVVIGLEGQVFRKPTATPAPSTAKSREGESVWKAKVLPAWAKRASKPRLSLANSC